VIRPKPQCAIVTEGRERPPRGSITGHLYVRADAELLSAVERGARAASVSVSEFVRRAIRAALK
jgi:predicted HicB family RNase H-like nuclease